MFIRESLLKGGYVCGIIGVSVWLCVDIIQKVMSKLCCNVVVHWRTD